MVVHRTIDEQLSPRPPACRLAFTEGESMLKGIVAALALGFAVPALADKGDTKKDVHDTAADAVDNVKDTLHTDKGADKAKRHMDKKARAAKRKARHTKNNVKRDLGVK
jgi:hypothetical protein